MSYQCCFLSISRCRMRYVAAYLLAALGGNSSPSAKDIKKILGSVGIEADDEKLNKVIDELKGKEVDEVMAEGKPKKKSPTGMINCQEKAGIYVFVFVFVFF